jgi:hypothetical protein
MAAATGLTIAWSGSAAVCFAVVVIAGFSVRSFWHYEPGQTADDEPSDEPQAAGDPQAEDSRRAS